MLGFGFWPSFKLELNVFCIQIPFFISKDCVNICRCSLHSKNAWSDLDRDIKSKRLTHGVATLSGKPWNMLQTNCCLNRTTHIKRDDLIHYYLCLRYTAHTTSSSLRGSRDGLSQGRNGGSSQSQSREHLMSDQDYDRFERRR